MLKILITGGLGNIGVNLAKSLIEKGYSLILFDNRTDRNHLFEEYSNVEIINENIKDFTAVKKAIHKIDGVIHLAAISRVVWGFENPYECILTNIIGFSNILEAIRLSQEKKWIIFGSSREVYGEPETIPISENADKDIANVYGVTKLTGEFLLEKYCMNYNLSGISLRFSNVYGSKYDQLDRVIPKFLLNISNNKPIIIQGGGQLFDFTHINDTTKGILKAIDHLTLEIGNNNSQYYNDFHILTGEGSSLIDVVNILNSFFKFKVNLIYEPARSYDVEKFYGDPKKAAELLNYKYSISLYDGISMLINELKDKLGSKNPLINSDF